MNILPMESLKNAIGIYKTTLAVYPDLANEDYSPVLDRVTLSFLEELKEYREYGTIEEFKNYKLGDCMNNCDHYDNCSNYIYSKGYNKAIDDFAELLHELCGMEIGDCQYQDILHESRIDEIAEQLKSQTEFQ